jgi:hypothetical protein
VLFALLCFALQVPTANTAYDIGAMPDKLITLVLTPAPQSAEF